MYKVLLFAVGLPLFLGCSDDEPSPVCFQEEGRRIVTVLTNESGTIRGLREEFCSLFFTIDPDKEFNRNPVGILGACNFPEEFQVDGQRVLFSGFIYESFETEDICADFFEITEIEIISDDQ